MSGAVEGLKAFQVGYALSLDVHRASLQWPKIEQYGGVADQLRRASKAVCSLMMEGAGRRRSSQAEFRRYLVMALGSADEARLWCRYAEDLGYAAPPIAAAWRGSFEEVARLLQGLLAKSDREVASSPDR